MITSNNPKKKFVPRQDRLGLMISGGTPEKFVPRQDRLGLMIEGAETRKPLVDPYARTRAEYVDILGASSYQLSLEQLNTLMGRGGELPQRQEELTLTIGSRSARRVTPQSNSLTLGGRS